MPKFDRQKLYVGLGIAYLAGVGAQLSFAIVLLRATCESFGCIGIGIGWIAWLITFAAVLICGSLVRQQLSASPLLQRCCRAVLWLQMVQGLGLLVYYLTYRAMY